MKVIFHFTNLDNFMSTKEEASVMMEINADNEQHLYMMATHLKNVLQADYYTIGE